MTAPHQLASAILLVLSATVLAKPVDVSLKVADDGRCTLQGKPVALSELRARLLELKAAYPDAQLRVSGSDKVSHAQMAPVVKIVDETGLVRLRFVTDWPDTPASSASATSASGARR